MIVFVTKINIIYTIIAKKKEKEEKIQLCRTSVTEEGQMLGLLNILLPFLNMLKEQKETMPNELKVKYEKGK